MDLLLNLRVTGIKKETEEAFTFFLESTDQSQISYQPGQFLTLIFEFNSREVRRSYSIITAPGIDKQIAITIKRIVNGEISRYLLDHLKTGDVIKSLYPTGRFALDAGIENNCTYYFLAAGSGITPVYSLLKTILHTLPESSAVLVYSNKSELSTIFYKELKTLEQKFFTRLKCIFLFSVKGERLNNSLLEKLVTSYKNALSTPFFYICGPRDYMRMCIFTLTYMGFAKEQLHKEIFASDYQKDQRSERIPGNPVSRTVCISYNHSIHYITVPPYKSILDAALMHNISLPYSCRAGVCSTCMAYCNKGKVEMTVNEVLTEGDLKKGLVLTCTGYPLTDEVEIVIKS